MIHYSERVSEPTATLVPTGLDAVPMPIRQVDPGELTPGEFADDLRRAVNEREIRLLVIDRLNGYLYAMPDERLVNLSLHELLVFLSQQGVTLLLTGAQHGVGSTQLSSQRSRSSEQVTLTTLAVSTGVAPLLPVAW